MTTRRGKVLLLTSFIIISAFIPVFRLSRVSTLPLDIYKRFQLQLIATSIIQTGELAQFAYPEATTLYPRAADLIHSPANPLLVGVVSEITALSVFTAQSFPFYTVQFIILQTAIAARLFDRQLSYILTPATSILVIFPILRIISTADRHILVWIELFVVILIMLLSAGERSSRYFYVFIVATLGFVMADHTHPIAFVIFFGTIMVAGNLLEKNLLSQRHAIFYIVLMLSYFTLIFSFGTHVLTVFIGILNSGVSFSLMSPVRPSTFPQELEPYVRALSSDSTRYLYFSWSVATRLIAAVVCAFAAMVWLRSIKRRLPDRKYKIFDIFMVGLGAQVIFDIFTSFIIPKSDGISPITLAIVMAPVLVPYVVRTVANHAITVDVPFKATDPTINVVLIAIILVFISHSIILSIPSSSYSPISDSGNDQLRWTVQNGNGEKIVSDFKTLSAYITFGGADPLFLPTSDIYDSNSVQTFVEIYYTKPSKSFDFADVYIINDKMKTIGMYHLGGLATKANPQLTKQLDIYNEANKVYTTSEDVVYVSTN